MDGVITEDSDVFLFGAKKVYRGVFQDNIKFFDSERIQQKLRLTREKMILFALLVGSDYTVGVKGIGIVNAMEILKAFDSLGKLKKFKEWAVHADLFLHPEHRTENITKLSKEEEK